MSDTKHAGRYLAEIAGAFEPDETPQEVEPEPVTKAATAPLGELAVAHMMPERLVAFWRWYGDLS